MLELRPVLGAVVKAEGSTYRRPGARLLATRSGEWVGGVSGGCLEGDLGRKAWWRTRSGPTVVTYDSTADDETAWQFGLGCNGVVHVLLERLTPGNDPLALPRQCLARDEPGVLATVLPADPGIGAAIGERLAVGADGKSRTTSARANRATGCASRPRSACRATAPASGLSRCPSGQWRSSSR